MDQRVEKLRQWRTAGDHVAALRLARQILQDPGELTDRELFDVARMGAGAAMAMESFFEARALTQEEIRYAEATGDTDLQAVAHYHHGTVEMYVGNITDALASFGAFTYADTPNRPALAPYRAASAFNAGTVHITRRQYGDAVRAFHSAQEAYQSEGNIYGVIQCLLQESWALLMDDRHEPAGLRLEQAHSLLEEHPDPALQNTAACHQAFYHLRLREYQEATALCEQLFSPGREGLTAHHQSEAAWLAGECALAIGQLEQAEQLSQIAQHQATLAKWPSLMNRATDLRRRIREAGDQTA